jgi:hypothetical protein
VAGRIFRSSSQASRDAATLPFRSSRFPATSSLFAVASRSTIVLCPSVAVPAGSAMTREMAAASCHCSRMFYTHW